MLGWGQVISLPLPPSRPSTDARGNANLTEAQRADFQRPLRTQTDSLRLNYNFLAWLSIVWCCSKYGPRANDALNCPAMVWLIVARAVQGIGAGSILGMTLIVISDIVSLEERGKYSGFIGATVCLPPFELASLAVGDCQCVGSNHWWGTRSTCFLALVFLYQPPVSTSRFHCWLTCRTGGFAIAVLMIFLKLNPHKRITFSELVHTFDWIGLILFVSGIVLFLTALAIGGNGTFAWNSSVVIGTIVPGVVCLVAAVFNELYTKRQALIPKRLFKTRTTAGILISVFLHGAVFMPAMFFLPLYFQAVDGSSPTFSGVQSLPLSLMTAVTATATGFIIAKSGDYRWILWISWTILTLGTPSSPSRTPTSISAAASNGV